MPIDATDFSKLTTLVSESWFNLVAEQKLDPIIGCGRFTLATRNVGCKCEWLKSHIGYE